MKIAPKIIESYVKKPDTQHCAILLYGPDSGLVRERSKRLTTAFLGEKFDPFALMDVSASKLLDDTALLCDELSSINFMAPKRVILVRDASDKLTRTIEESAASFNDSVLLLVCADELSARSSLRAWFEKETNVAALACYHDDVRDIQDVIRKTLDTAGVQADRHVIDYLSSQLGNDRYVTYQELEKLVTYAGESKTLQLSDAEALVGYNKEASFDDLVNAVADRNLQQLEKTLTLLLREGTQPVAYLRSLQRYFNKLYFIRCKMAEGQSAEAVVQGLRPPVFFKQAPILTRHAQNWSLPNLAKALRLLVSGEQSCKTSDLPIIPASSRFLLQITQIR
jgi:DNA polymerase-3 subunit delta